MSLEMYDFIKKCEPNYLKVKDIKKLKIGDELDVVIWDTNFEEYYIWKKCEQNKKYDSQLFFKENRCKLIYCENYKWKILDSDNNINLHPLHANYKSKWCIIGDKKEKSDLCETCNANKISFKDLTDDTYIGWRGYIMLWDKLKDIPFVHYK